MRVLFVSPVAEMGGAEQVLLSLARYLTPLGCETSLALLRPGNLEKIAQERGLRVHTFPKQYAYRDVPKVMECTRWLTQVIRDEKAEIVHCNHTGHLISQPASRKAGSTEVWHLHDYPYQWDIMDAINRKMGVDSVLFTTNFVQSGFPDLVKRAPHTVIHPDCIEVDKLRAASPDPSVRERMNLGDAPFFLTVTRLQEHKGHTYLIQAAAKVLAERPDVNWMIAGKASGAEQEAYLAGLKQQASDLGIADRIRFAGFVSDADLAALSFEATALVHPALTEGYGLVLIEAMARGTAVITAAAEGPKEIVADGENGLIVPVRDADALARAMLRLLNEPDLRQRLIAGGTVFADTHSVQKMTEATLAFYRQVLSQKTATK